MAYEGEHLKKIQDAVWNRMSIGAHQAYAHTIMESYQSRLEAAQLRLIELMKATQTATPQQLADRIEEL